MVTCVAMVAGEFLASSLLSYGPVLSALPLREGLDEHLRSEVQWSQEWGNMLRFYKRAVYGGEPDFTKSLVAPVSEAMIGIIRAILAAAQERGELRTGLDMEQSVRIVHALLAIVGDSALLLHLAADTHLGEDPDVEISAAVIFILTAIAAIDE